MSRKKYVTSADRILANVEVDPASGCWNWQRRVNRGGYGIGNHYVAGARVTYRAHRLAYETFIGPVPDGLPLDHLCRNRRCCNPEHLEAVPQQVNLMRSPLAITAQNAAKTHCPRNHPYDDVNTYRRPGRSGRGCRACLRATQVRRAFRTASVPSERVA